MASQWCYVDAAFDGTNYVEIYRNVEENLERADVYNKWTGERSTQYRPWNVDGKKEKKSEEKSEETIEEESEEINEEEREQLVCGRRNLSATVPLNPDVTSRDGK